MNLLNGHLWVLTLFVIAGMTACERFRYIKKHPLLVGTILGVISCVCSYFSINIADIGIHVCIRDVSITSCALFFGPWAGLLAGGIGALGCLLLGIWEQTGIWENLPYALGTFFIGVYAIGVRIFICNNKRPGMLFTAMILLVGELLMYIYLSFFVSMELIMADLFNAFVPECFFKIICGTAMAFVCRKSDDRLCREYEKISNVLIVMFLVFCALVCLVMMYLVKLDMDYYINECLNRLFQKNGAGVSLKLYSALVDIQTKEGINSANGDFNTATMAHLAEKYNLQKLFICDNQGRLKGCNGDIVSESEAFDEAWKYRFRQIGQQKTQGGCESSFVKDGLGMGDDMTFAHLQLNDKSGFILAGMDKKHYFQNVETLGIPDVWVDKVGMYGSFVIVKKDTQTIEGIYGDYREGFGGQIAFFQKIKEENGANERKIRLGRVYGYSCLYKYVDIGAYYYIAVIPAWEAFELCIIGVRIIAFFLVITIFFVGKTWRIKVRERQKREEEQRAEAKRRNEDLATASTIQKSSLPSIFQPFPVDVSVDLFATMQPALEVGGDFYDYYHLSPSRIAFLVADVSGKGIPAAMFMMRAKSIIKSNITVCDSLEEAMNRVNRQLSADNPAGMFVTCWVGILNTDEGRLEYVNAGHNPPYILHRDSSITKLDKVSGLFLAGMEDMEYTKYDIKLAGNDILFVYSDGVTEAENTEGAMFDEERLEAALKAFKLPSVMKAGQGVPSELCTYVGREVRSFTGSASQFDDITMLSLYYRGAVHAERCTVNADSQGLARLTEFLEKQLNKLGCGEELVNEMLIVLDEIGTNVNNYSGSPELTLDIMHIEFPNMLKLRFIDSGKPYNPLQVPPPDLSLDDESRPIGGLGLYIVKKVVDGLYYEYSKQQNNVYMIKYISKQS